MRITTIAASLFSLAIAGSVWAEDLPVPTGDIVLTVSGKLAHSNVDDTAQFDLELLEEMPVTRFETSTIWTEGTQVFEGVELADLVERLGLEGETLFASAINDYTVEIPLSDAAEGGPIIAYRIDGKEMSVREKGPLWVIYPYDKSSDYQTEVIYSRSIWQLDRIESR
ncbi:molybdopterin-dependent oxidoreductase [Microbulbifer sp. S227A]|uniref:molybdopterin-dependent oxidoreductase n=1 Tax=Microbulbifer sp. S227A TaxID=3415131 RepID=UPI003C7D98E8